jgi:(5-formylfuran-3-yl)methyl phosphate synthase
VTSEFPERPGLLVSFRSVDEWAPDLANHVDIVDLKEPGLGPLAPVSAETARQFRHIVGPDCLLSVALGELTDYSAGRFEEHFQAANFAKLGFAGLAGVNDWRQRWRAAIESFPPHVHPVAAAYADHGAAQSPSPEEILELAVETEARYFLIDTFSKKSGSIFSLIEWSRLVHLGRRAQQFGICFVLAGSLRIENLDQVLGLQPDLVGIRGAVTHGARDSAIDPEKVIAFHSSLQTDSHTR